MNSSVYERVRKNPKFQELVTKRSRFGWQLSLVMLVVYFSFILTIAFAPQVLGMRLGEGVITLGLPVGIGIIFLAFVLTGIYVKRANDEFDSLTEAIKEDARLDE